MDKGDYAAACPRLSESYAQDPATGTLLALAVCEEQAGRTASAWAHYAEAAVRAKREGQTDRERAARARVRDLGPTLSRLIVEVSSAAESIDGLVVQRDGVALGRGAWGVSSPVDPGQHVVEVKAPGKRPFRAVISVAPNADLRTVFVPALEDQPATESPPPAPAVGLELAPFPTEDRGAESLNLRTIGLIVGGGGVVALGVSGYQAWRAKGLEDDSLAEGRCDANNECDAQGLAYRSDSVAAADAATVAFVVGGVLVGTGITLFLVGSSDREDQAHVRVTPGIGRGVGGLSVTGTF